MKLKKLILSVILTAGSIFLFATPASALKFTFIVDNPAKSKRYEVVVEPKSDLFGSFKIDNVISSVQRTIARRCHCSPSAVHVDLSNFEDAPIHVKLPITQKTKNSILYNIFANGHAEVAEYNGSSPRRIDLKSSIRAIRADINVTEIAPYAFFFQKNATPVPYQVHKDGSMSYKQKQLMIFNFPPDCQIRKIGYLAFLGINLGDFTMPDSVIEIGQEAFEYCLFTDLHLSNQLKKIGIKAFKGATLDQELTFPASVEEIGDQAFSAKYSVGLTGRNELLTAIIFAPGSHLLTIGENAFEGTKINQEILLPDTIETVGLNAFGGHSFRVVGEHATDRTQELQAQLHPRPATTAPKPKLSIKKVTKEPERPKVAPKPKPTIISSPQHKATVEPPQPAPKVIQKPAITTAQADSVVKRSELETDPNKVTARHLLANNLAELLINGITSDHAFMDQKELADHLDELLAIENLAPMYREFNLIVHRLKINQVNNEDSIVRVANEYCDRIEAFFREHHFDLTNLCQDRTKIQGLKPIAKHVEIVLTASELVSSIEHSGIRIVANHEELRKRMETSLAKGILDEVCFDFKKMARELKVAENCHYTEQEREFLESKDIRYICDYFLKMGFIDNEQKLEIMQHPPIDHFWKLP